MCVCTRVCEEPSIPDSPSCERRAGGGVRMGAASADYVMGIIKISLYSNPQGRFPAKVTAIISPSFITLGLGLQDRGGRGGQPRGWLRPLLREEGRGLAEGTRRRQRLRDFTGNLQTHSFSSLPLRKVQSPTPASPKVAALFLH